MGKKRQAAPAKSDASSTTKVAIDESQPKSLQEWTKSKSSRRWVIGCMVVGMLVGYLAGAYKPTPWRQRLANKIRASSIYYIVSGRWFESALDRFAEWAERVERDIQADEFASNPSHPKIFAVLREAIVREKGGYVHPDLGFLVPAPCGAARGIGMVRDSYHKCQVDCFPGVADEKHKQNNTSTEDKNKKNKYCQEEVLIKLPLAFQMTRTVALNTLLPLIPSEVQKRASLHELDDAALLVLLLAHERGLGRRSRWVAYIASLPQPSCGYSQSVRPFILDALSAYRDTRHVEVHGWEAEITKASDYSDKITAGLNSDYGAYLKTPRGVSQLDNLRWALCQVASRATAGAAKYGTLRLLPLVDLINHDIAAGGFVELTGSERYKDGDFVDASEHDAGAFVVRSLRHGRRKALKKSQELLVNYNVDHYSPLDWMLSLGFIPPERWGGWEKIDPVLPELRTDGPFRNSEEPTSDQWEEKNKQVLEQLRNSNLHS